MPRSQRSTRVNGLADCMMRRGVRLEPLIVCVSCAQPQLGDSALRVVCGESVCACLSHILLPIKVLAFPDSFCTICSLCLHAAMQNAVID